MKGSEKRRNYGCMVWLGVNQGHRQCRRSIENIYDFLIDFDRNYIMRLYSTVFTQRAWLESF